MDVSKLTGDFFMKTPVILSVGLVTCLAVVPAFAQALAGKVHLQAPRRCDSGRRFSEIERFYVSSVKTPRRRCRKKAKRVRVTVNPALPNMGVSRLDLPKGKNSRRVWQRKICLMI